MTWLSTSVVGHSPVELMESVYTYIHINFAKNDTRDKSNEQTTWSKTHKVQGGASTAACKKQIDKQ